MMMLWIKSIYFLTGLITMSGALDMDLNKILHDVPNGRIIGGRNASDTDAQYMVHIVTYDYIKGKNYHCGGTVISEEYVLTAAHCLINQLNATLLFGTHYLNKPFNGDQVRHCNHQDHFFFKGDADIALIKLPEKVSIKQNGIDSVTLATSRSDIDYSKTARAYGWGRTGDTEQQSKSNSLLYVDVPLQRKCADDCAQVRKEICISGIGFKGTCKGDSGGPLIQNNVQIGVTARGYGNCDNDYPRVFVSVHENWDWIKSHANII